MARPTSSQVDIPNICRGAGLIQLILRLGSVALVLTVLLQAIQQHHLNLLLAGFEAILEGRSIQTRAVSKGNRTQSDQQREHTRLKPAQLHTPVGGGGLVTKSFLTLATPWTPACQAPLSM